MTFQPSSSSGLSVRCTLFDVHSTQSYGWTSVVVCSCVGLSWLVQEYYELRNLYRSVTFLPDSATDTRRGSRAGSGPGHSSSLKMGLWPRQTTLGRIKSMLSDHYKDPWNQLDLLIILFILVHCLLSTTWAVEESAGLTSWSELRPTRTVTSWFELRPTRTEPRTRLVLAPTAILAWFRCLGLMKVHPKLGPMVTITLIMFGNIVQVIVLHSTPQRR